MIRRLDELLDIFSVAYAYRRATISHPRNTTFNCYFIRGILLLSKSIIRYFG